MEREQELEAKLSETTLSLAEKDRLLAEKEIQIKELSELKEKMETEARNKELSEQVENLCLSNNKNIGFKGGEKEKILSFVKTLSKEQSEEYFKLHSDIITGVNLNEEGEAGENKKENNEEQKEEKAQELAQKLVKEKGLQLHEALTEAYIQLGIVE